MGQAPNPLKKLLIANRGEIAVRIAGAAAGIGIETVAIHSTDDAASSHNWAADAAVALPGTGASGYLDITAIIVAATEAGCDSLHPGYGFAAENPELARACEQAGLVFVGPTADQLDLFGDKVAARHKATELGVPLMPATGVIESTGQAQAFLDEHGAVMVKAVGGGGGRGMRIVRSGDNLDSALQRCSSEAAAAFGSGEVYLERLVERARHIEIQIVGDGESVTHLGERECTLQRQNQKVVEVAPAPGLPDATRDALTNAAITMAAAVRYRSLGTWEFIVDADDPSRVAYLETNARIQVEHTVTEEVTGVDLCQAQLNIAGGATLNELGLNELGLNELGLRSSIVPRGFAVQCRVNTETMTNEGTARPTGGVLTAFEPPSGPGVRTDTYGYTGYPTNPAFDSLLAKVIGQGTEYGDAIRRVARALAEFRIEGVATNREFLLALLNRPEVLANEVTTSLIADNAAEINVAAQALTGQALAGQAHTVEPAAGHSVASTRDDAQRNDAMGQRAGAIVDDDPLAVLKYGDITSSGDTNSSDRASDPRTAATTPGTPGTPTTVVIGPDTPDTPGTIVIGPDTPTTPGTIVIGPDNTNPVEAPLQGTIVSLSVEVGDAVAEGQPVAVMEAMKMEHIIASTQTGFVRQLGVTVGDTIYAGHPLVFVEPAEVDFEAADLTEQVDLDYIRPDLAEVLDRHIGGLDENRTEAVAKRHGRGHRTARENVADLVDEGTFVEYGPLVLAAQRRRRSVEDLIANTQGDGMVAGIGHVNGNLFDTQSAQTLVMSYDYMVLAGTQGGQNHRKKDRLFEVAKHNQLPVVLLAEGGGGRPGDTDGVGGSGLDCWAFTAFAQLSGLVPLVGVTNGRCFAGNAVLLGCCDVIIATQGSNIGVGGPAMIEGGGLGVYRPEEVGPVDVQWSNGVIDILVDDEAEAMTVAKQYLSYFQGSVDGWEAHDPRLLRSLIPENRLRAYDIREVIDKLCDVDSVLELRRGWGPGCVTALARIEGKPIGIVANNNHHLGGAIDADVGDKGSRFIQLCDAHDIPLLFLCDTPGIMVGPQAEYEATVRHAARMFVTAANVEVPFMTIVLRKGYGLGAQAMAGGSFKAPIFTVAWPTGEFGGMGLEGFVKLGYRKELEAIDDPVERKAQYEQRVAQLYENGKAVNTATFFEIDDVIDPAVSREWIRMALLAGHSPTKRTTKKRAMVDTW